MPAITDPALLAELNGSPRQPQPTQSPASRIKPLFTAPADPRQAAADARADTSTTLSLRKDARDAESDAVKIEKDRLAIEEKRAALAARGGVDTTESERTAAFLATRVRGGIDDIRRANRDGPGEEKPTFLATVTGGLLGDRSEARNAANSATRQRIEEAQRDVLDAALTLGTGAAYTQEQIENYRASHFPRLTDAPETVADKRIRLRRLLEAAKLKAGASAPLIDEAIANLDKEMGGGAVPEGAAQDDLPKTAFALTPGWSPTPEQNEAVIAFMKTNPTPEAYAQFAKALTGREVTIAEATRVINGIKKGAEFIGFSVDPGGESTWKDDLGAFAIKAADGMSAGLLPEAVGLVAGDDVEARMEGNLDAVEAESPTASTLGEITGMIGGSAALGGAAAKGLTKLAPNVAPAITQGGGRVAAARTAGNEAAFGAISGAGNAEDGERLGEAGTGALVALGGTAAGNLVGKGVSRMIAPKVNPQVKLLRDKGVRTSIGQSIGPNASRIEEAVTSIPVIGGMARAQREQALGDFNRVVIDDALDKIGMRLPENTEGTKAMGFAQKAFSTAYEDALSGMALVPTGALVDDLNALYAKIKVDLDPPDVKAIKRIYDAHVHNRVKAGRINGEDYKAMVSKIGKLADTAKRKQNLDRAEALNDLKEILNKAARQSSPPEAVAKLDATDEGYALFVRAENAAKMRGGETGMMTPSQYDAAVQKGDSSVRSKAYLRGEALGQDLAQAGKSILRDNVGNSGTTDRALVGMGAAGYFAPGTLAPLAGLGAAYMPGLRDSIAAAIAREPSPKAQSLAEFIREKMLTGRAGAATALGVYTGQ
jgi:hypothetical protein